MSTPLDRPFDLLIGGSETPGTRGERAPVKNPASNEDLAPVAVGHADDARHAMEVAQAAFEGSWWASDDGGRRAKALWKLAGLLEARLEEFARLETLNMGKTLKEARGDMGFVVRSIEYVAGLADKVEGETVPVPGARLDYTIREPFGVTVHIAPWNYPLLLAIRGVAPALAAGNAAVLKPASLTPLTAIAFGRLAKDAGIPDGILNVVAGPGGEVGEALVNDLRCKSVSFTGSGDVGRRIAELAARRTIPATLELGGKSPVVVFPDADLDRAARGIAFGIFGNAGQMCWAGSRLIVHDSIHAALVERVAKIASAMRLGPGIAPESEMGPLVSPGQLERVAEFVESARSEGGQVRTGGARASAGELAQGNFYPPTIVDDAPPSARAVREEIFGPVLVVHPFASTDDAVRLANATDFGLFAALWTKDLATAHTVARRLEAGIVCVNEAPVTFPQTPFGGFKQSGLGFEQGSEVVRSYTRRKNVVVNLSVPKPKG
ncbi:MAG: aldehyde dehydrogenase family protein [Thermoplasmata archaeon]|nr:aldehyde dehydrogenase family protein [Thermoplasmata archaeon]MCI4356504.1 aldehyde dehydrogenase family protein [Thermoplasmata archaeon]